MSNWSEGDNSVDLMALFTAASKHFVKAAGSSSLHNVPDLNSADRFKVLCLVYRKTSFWPWKKPKIKPTLVTLNDVLQKVGLNSQLKLEV